MNNTIIVNGYSNWDNVNTEKLDAFMCLVEKRLNWYDEKYANRLFIMIKQACVYNEEYTIEEIQEIGSKWQHGYSMPSSNCLLFVDDFVIVKFNVVAAKNGYYNIHFENGCLR